MSVRDVVAAMVSQVRSQLNGTAVTVEDGGAREGEAVLVDPGRFSQAFAIACRHLTHEAAPANDLLVRAAAGSRCEQRGLEVSLSLRGPQPADRLRHKAASGLEWALAEKIVALHGGELSENDRHDEVVVTMFLPIVTN
jgi:hypothetical protein